MRAFFLRLLQLNTASPGSLPRPSVGTVSETRDHHTSPAGDWRAARDELPALQEAVARMEEHIDMLRQIADAWLLAANVHSRDEADFARNVRTADEMAHSIEWECAAVIAEVRQLAADTARRPAAEHLLAQLQALIEWTREQEASLHRRLRDAATAEGLDVGDLRAARRTQIVGATTEAVEALLPHFSQGSFPPLSLCLE